MIMSELSPRARELTRSGRALLRPTDADRTRIRAALRARLGEAALPMEVNRAAPAARPRWLRVSSVVVGVGMVGGALLFGLHHQPRAASHPPQVVTAMLATSAAAPLATAAELLPAAPAALPASSDAPAPAARPARDRLAQEVALMTRATSDLHAGHAAEALRVLDEYQRLFPKGLLTEERRAARAQALCSLGRQSEARAELARLAPQSPSAARAKQFCDARAATGR